MKKLITITCPKHEEIKRIVYLDDYTKALESGSRKKIWFCKICGTRLRKDYSNISFIISNGFNTRRKE